jgi:sugar/nucleoside kinase (ribokinase family)
VRAATPHGLFVGLSTLDVIQRVAEVPGPDAKVTAVRQDVSGGGPALNAAVVFAALGGRATLLTRLGTSGIARLVRDDVESHGVTVLDVADDVYVPAVSTILVQDRTGDRRVISTDDRGGGAGPPRTAPLHEHEVVSHLQGLEAVDVAHLDGHHADLTVAAARWARGSGALRVVDAGRWKPVLGQLVRLSTDVICSADFAVPGADEELLPWLLSRGVELAAVTNGQAAVRWATPSAEGTVDPTPVTVVDTVGAGDFFHGAYSFARTVRDDAGRVLTPTACLAFASTVAALKCARPGTRDWLDGLVGLSPWDHDRGQRA